MFELPTIFDEEKESKYGIDKLDFMCKFIRVIEGKQVKEEYALLKLWLRYKIKRHLTEREEFNLVGAIHRYVKSDGGTQERLDSMKYLINIEFLIEPVGA
jgi:hypothetical protein